MTATAASSADRLAPYIPRTLVEASVRHGHAPTWHEWLDGALMHCDITGFTAMSESLAALGNEGAELMASVLNDFFETMLRVADAWGGVQMKFGGDAMLLYFAGSSGAACGAACGLEMQQQMPRFKRVAVAGKMYELRMRIGVHAGRFFSVSVGSGDGHLQYVLLGEDVNETAKIESLAKPGHVVATEAAAHAMGDRATIVEQRDGVLRVLSVAAPKPEAAVEAPIGATARRYILPPLLDAVGDDGIAGLPAEQRRVTSMFVTLDGTTAMLERRGADETFRQVNAYVALLVDAVGRHGGVVLGSDVADHGDKFIVLFGAPVLQQEHEAGAMRCAADLMAALASSGLDVTQQIGINTGTVFAGEIGSHNRREYTVIGDTVNLAARLMAAAKPNETLVAQSTIARAAGAFVVKRRKPIRVKGKTEPVRFSQLVAGAADGIREPASTATPFVGRANDVAALLKAVRQARRAQPSWSLISGDAGIGKTRLAHEVEQQLVAGGWHALHAAAKSHTSNVPFGVWIDPLQRLVGVEREPDPQRAALVIQSHVERDAQEHAPFWELLADLLGVHHAESDLLASLDARVRRERLTAIVVAVIEARARAAPLLVVLDDAQWADASSLELLSEVVSRVKAPVSALVMSRDPVAPESIGHAPASHVRLRGLPVAESRDLLAPLVADEGVLSRIVKRAQGNPLFMIELAQAPTGAAMPETVNDVVLARLDALRRSDREMLRLASVIGPSFDLASVAVLDTASTGSYIAETCARLIDAGLLQSDDGAYAFTHTLTREVAYETLLYADRRRLHRSLAAHIEREHEGDTASAAESLLHHYRAAREWSSVAAYGLLSGDRAASIFATLEAVAYYQAALDALDEVGARVRVDRSIVLERMGDALDTAGRHREAGDAYFTALHEWLAKGGEKRPRHVRAELRATARESLVSRKISVSYERRSDYDQALSWIETALERLPEGAISASAEVMASKSVTLFRRGSYAEAIEWGQRAVALARRGRDRRISAYAHNMLANSYIEQGALKQAVRHLTPSERLYQELGDLKGQSAAGNNLASCHQLLGNMDEALRHYEAALAADIRLGNATHAAIVHNNIGEVLLTIGRVAEAREHLQQVLRAHEDGSGLAALTGLSEVNLARCALVEGDPATAELHVRRGIRLLQGVGAQGLLDEAELQLVEVRIAQGKHDAAIKRCRAAIDRAHSSGARLLEARGLRLLGVALAANGNVDAGRQQLEASAELARGIDAGIEEGRALIELARLQRSSGFEGPVLARMLDRAETIASRAGATLDVAEIRRLRGTVSTSRP